MLLREEFETGQADGTVQCAMGTATSCPRYFQVPDAIEHPWDIGSFLAQLDTHVPVSGQRGPSPTILMRRDSRCVCQKEAGSWQESQQAVTAPRRLLCAKKRATVGVRAIPVVSCHRSRKPCAIRAGS